MHRYSVMHLFHFFIFMSVASWALAQTEVVDDTMLKLHEVSVIEEANDTIEQLYINGQLVSALISEGDTLFFAELGNVMVSSPRTFASKEDYLKYLRYRRYAAKVYPYAKQAIRIFREAEHVTATMKKRKRKKFLRKLSKELEEEFTEPLKNLSKTQGKILVKMIERELDARMFDLIKMTQGKIKAFYWNQSSKLYGYRLKHGYQPGQNPILDVVLQDFDISYDVVEN